MFLLHGCKMKTELLYIPWSVSCDQSGLNENQAMGQKKIEYSLSLHFLFGNLCQSCICLGVRVFSGSLWIHGYVVGQNERAENWVTISR